MLYSTPKYILLVKFILSSFTCLTFCFKTYQVHRINETAYLVIAVPDFNDNNETRHVSESNNNENNLINKPKTSYKGSNFTNPYSSSIINHQKGKISQEEINKARETYFRIFNATMKPTPSIGELFPIVPAYTNVSRINNIHNNCGEDTSAQNLETARSLVSALLQQIHFKPRERIKRKSIKGRSQIKRFQKNTDKWRRF